MELYTNLFFKGKLITEEGYVIRVLKNGFSVLIPKYGIEGLVHAGIGAAAGTQPLLVFSEEGGTLTAPADGVVIKLFDRVRVNVMVEEAGVDQGRRSKLVIKLVEPVINGLSVTAFAAAGDQGGILNNDKAGNTGSSRPVKKSRM